MKMLKIIAVAAACIACSTVFAQKQSNPHGSTYGSAYGNLHSNPYGSVPANGYTNPNSHSVTGYGKSNGTYVAPSHATNPNKTKSDNYSTKGNVNPYTGKAGTK